MIWISMIFISALNIISPLIRNVSAGKVPFEGIPVASPVLIIIGIAGAVYSRRTIRDSGWHCALPPLKMLICIPLILVTVLAAVPLLCAAYSAGKGTAAIDNWRRIILPSCSLLAVYLLASSVLTMCFSLCKTINKGTVIIPSKLAAVVAGGVQIINIFVFMKLCGLLFPYTKSSLIKDWAAGAVSTVSGTPYSSIFDAPASIRIPINIYMVMTLLAIIAIAVTGTSFGRMYRNFSETIGTKADNRNRLSNTGYCVWCEDYSVPLYRVYRISYGRVRKPCQKLLTDNGFDKLSHSLESGKITDVNVDTLRSEFVMSGSGNPIADIDEKKIPVNHWCCQRCGMTVYESLRGYSGPEPVNVKLVGPLTAEKKNFCAVLFRDYASKFMRPDTAEYIYFNNITAPKSSRLQEEAFRNAPEADRSPALTFRYDERFFAFSILSDAAVSSEVNSKDVFMVFIDGDEFNSGAAYFPSIIDATETVRSLSTKVSHIIIAVASFDLIGGPEVPNRCTAMDNAGKSSTRNSTFRNFFKCKGADVFDDLWNECRSRCEKIDIVGHTAPPAIPSMQKDSQPKLITRHITETLDIILG